MGRRPGRGGGRAGASRRLARERGRAGAVLETRIPPGETTPVHTHRWPNVQHILSTSDFVRRDEAGEVVIDTRTTGELPARSATRLERCLVAVLEEHGLK
jgi:hypothetical protein